MGKATIGLAVMEHQFIMQLLGTGSVERMIDTEGGCDELVRLWTEAGSTVKVKSTASSERPVFSGSRTSRR